MKTISLNPFKTTLIILLFGASSCSNNNSQGTTTSVADSISKASRKTDSVMNRKNAANTGVLANSTDSVANNNGNNNSQSNLDSKRTWSLIITPSTTKSYLDSIAAIWKNENIDLNISTLKYDGGNLVKIKGSVTINTKAGNHASGEFKSENLASIRIKVDDSPNGPNVLIKNN